MKKRGRRGPSAAMVVASLALIVALTGTAVAAQKLVSGDKLIKQRSLSGNRLRNHTLTGKQINLGKLGTVPSAVHAAAAVNADHATSAVTATSAATATDATQLGGSPPSAFQSRVSGACTASSGVQQVNADGTVSCGSTSFYSGRIVTALNSAPTTFLTIPGIAHVVSLNCQAASANAEIENDGKATDIWLSNDTSYVGTNWLGANSTPAVTGGATWHLGRGSGPGAVVIAVTVNTEATGSNCIFQGYAQVMTS